jgi:apolipoprotein N-acyltransferase
MSEKPKEIRWESVGWIFWLISSAIFFPGFFWVSRQIAYDDQKNGMLPWILGFILASFLAGVLTTGLNTILQRRVEKIRAEESRLNKKNKKKSK